jgi:putative transposase
MCPPRRLLPQQTHAASRRVSERRFLLRPSSFVNEVVLYALARASQLCPQVRLHGFVAEANHTHASLTDAREDLSDVSQVPRFFQCLHRMTAAALNAHYGRGEAL